MTSREGIILACREIARMDNWLAELDQRRQHAPGRVDPAEVTTAQTRIDGQLDHLRDLLGGMERSALMTSRLSEAHEWSRTGKVDQSHPWASNLWRCTCGNQEWGTDELPAACAFGRSR